MPETVNTASSFSIMELSGDERWVTLIDRALPYRPLSLVTDQKVEVTWYPGNPHATASVLGAREAPTTIRGFWKDKFIGQQVENADSFFGPTTTPIQVGGEAVSDVRAAVDLLDDIVRKGQLLEVTWDAITRHGHLTSFEKQWHNSHDVEWSMKFEWISRGEPQAPAILLSEVSLSDASGELGQLHRGLLDSIYPPPFSLDGGFSSLVDAATRSIDEAMNEIEGAVANLRDQALSPSSAVRRVIAMSTQLVTFVDNLKSIISSVPDGFPSTQNDPVDTSGSIRARDTHTLFASLGFQDRLVAVAYNRAILRAATRLRDAAIARRARLVKQIDSEIQTSIFVREGEDLRTIAEQHYGSPFEWRRIMAFNGLSGSKVARGQLLLIPRADAGIC